MSVEHDALYPIDGEASQLGTRAAWQETLVEQPEMAQIASTGLRKAKQGLREGAARKYADLPGTPQVIDTENSFVKDSQDGKYATHRTG